jgi:CRISPR-associated endonuclease/helicase Cas3
LIERIREEPGGDGHIVVATQVVEAGIDLSARVLVTEAAPWPSLVQRAGRCNRTGRIGDAELWWLPPARHLPYEEVDVAATIAELEALEGVAVTGEDLLARRVRTTEPEVTVLRRPDLLTLFDTAPDLTGSDLDIGPYVRDADDLDVQLAWAEWTPADESGRPPADAKAPESRWRCRVPLGELRQLVKRAAVWRFGQGAGHGSGQWTKVSNRQPARPGEVLLASASAGGYRPDTGFDPTARGAVPDCPSLDPVPDPRTGTDPASGAEDAYQQDDASVAQRDWLPLDQHSDDVRAQGRALLTVIAPTLPAGIADAVVTAAYAHDAGKAHQLWQDALCALAPPEQRDRIDAGRPWAKSAVDGRLEYPHQGPFRHELVTLLLLDGPLRGLLSGSPDPDLVRYLALAHHGKLRVQVRGPDDTDEQTLLGLKHGAVETVPALLGQPAGALTVDLEPFSLGCGRSWTRTALSLRDRYGPFLLAYLETLVRIADWRASANLPEASR